MNGCGQCGDGCFFFPGERRCILSRSLQPWTDGREVMPEFRVKERTVISSEPLTSIRRAEKLKDTSGPWKPETIPPFSNTSAYIHETEIKMGADNRRNSLNLLPVFLSPDHELFTRTLPQPINFHHTQIFHSSSHIHFFCLMLSGSLCRLTGLPVLELIIPWWEF